jgi:hypothetical protein
MTTKPEFVRRVNFGSDIQYIFVSLVQPVSDDEFNTVYKKYFEKYKELVALPPREALFVDLRGEKPGFKSVPRDYDPLNA